jgi:hypothetical protein
MPNADVWAKMWVAGIVPMILLCRGVAITIRPMRYREPRPDEIRRVN